MMKVLACGTIMIDIFLRDLEKIAEPEMVVYPENPIDIKLGGHPIDVGIDLVKIGLAPSEVGVIVARGEGVVAEHLTHQIESYGIRTFFQDIKRIDNGKNVVINIKGEKRRKHMHPGANWYLEPEWVREVIRKCSFKVFSIRPGYSGVDLHLRKIFEEIRKKEGFILLDIMQPHPERPPFFILPELELVNAVHCNEEEAMINTGKDNPDDALKEILRQGAKTIFLTKGEKGAEIITQDFRISQPRFKIDAVDATGCGDAFCAGVIYKLIEYNEFNDIRNLSQEKLTDLLTFAQAAGAAAATAAGCTEGVLKNKVDQILGEQGEKILNDTVIKSGP